MSHTVDSYLMEIQADGYPGIQFGIHPRLNGTPTVSPDDELLIRHSEYQRPRDSRIVTAIKATGGKFKTGEPEKTEKSSGKKMTLAELAKSGIKGGENKDRSKSSSASQTPNITVKIPSGDEEEEDSDSLVRHSEFYKGSKTANINRRRSNESLNSIPGYTQERRPTLADMLEKQKEEKDNGQVEEKIGVPEVMGSAESIYSTDGGYSNNNVSGEIFIGYQYLNGTLKIKIFEARGLTAIDKVKNTSDPYVKVYLLPDQSRAGKRKTKVKHGTVDPEFNEEILFKIGARDLITRTMWLSLWSYGRFGRNEFLGELRLPLNDYNGKEVPAKWYTLSEMQPSTSDNQGELVVALMYSPTDKKKKKKEANAGKLHVHIVEAKNLAGKDSNNLSDPFCKSYLLPDRSRNTKNRTPVMKRNLNPHWNYKFTYNNVSIEDLEDRVLELTVWDHDLTSSNDFLGGVRIGLGTGAEPWNDSDGEEVTLWQFVLSKPNTWTQGILPLRNQMANKKV